MPRRCHVSLSGYQNLFSLAILNAIGGNYHDHVVYMGRGTGGSFFKGGQVVLCPPWVQCNLFVSLRFFSISTFLVLPLAHVSPWQIFMLQDVSIESEYRNYSRGTQQSLQAWSGEIIDIALVRHFFLFQTAGSCCCIKACVLVSVHLLCLTFRGKFSQI